MLFFQHQFHEVNQHDPKLVVFGFLSFPASFSHFLSFHAPLPIVSLQLDAIFDVVDQPFLVLDVPEKGHELNYKYFFFIMDLIWI